MIDRRVELVVWCVVSITIGMGMSVQVRNTIMFYNHNRPNISLVIRILEPLEYRAVRAFS